MTFEEMAVELGMSGSRWKSRMSTSGRGLPDEARRGRVCYPCNMVHWAAMDSWQEQFERVKRYLQRRQDRGRQRTSYEDDLWSFFRNCRHLKDWIKNDDTLPKDTREAIVDEVHQSGILMICRDLANRSKHLVLTAPGTGANLFAEAEVVDRDTPDVAESVYTLLWDLIVDLGDSFPRALEVAQLAAEKRERLFLKPAS